MSKKSLPVGMIDEANWKETDEETSESFPENSDLRLTKTLAGKPSRQRIEEYFELKRLAEILQEDLTDDFFRS